MDNEQKEWKEIQIEGGWFPETFVGTISGFQRYVLDKNVPLPHSTEDAYSIMKLVQAAYKSSKKGGIPFSDIK